MGTWTLGAKGGKGWALEGGFLGGGGSKLSGRKRAVSNASRHCLSCPHELEAALSLLDGINPGGRTHNSSLCYKRLERPAHMVSREGWGARYFLC